MPKVSVFIPCYNTEKYIEKTIECILEQSFSDWELIIVDDCSTDRSFEICKKYAERDSRIKLYRNEKNLGMMPNWNHGIQYCAGEYWGKLDADDLWGKTMLEDCVKILDTHSEVGMVATKYINIDEKGEFLSKEYCFPKEVVNQSISFIPFVKAGVHKMFAGNIAQQGIGLMRRRIFEELGKFLLIQCADTEMWFRIAGHYKIFCLEKLLHQHRIWSQSFTRKYIVNTSKQDFDLFEARQMIFDHYLENKFISQKEYNTLSGDNEFEISKVKAAELRKKGEWLNMIRLLARNFQNRPLSTSKFYLKRLIERQ